MNAHRPPHTHTVIHSAKQRSGVVALHVKEEPLLFAVFKFLCFRKEKSGLYSAKKTVCFFITADQHFSVFFSLDNYKYISFYIYIFFKNKQICQP